MFLPSDITLKSGDSGDYVSELQRRLVQRSLLFEGNISGLYDGNTTQAVMEFQLVNGLRTDGVAGPETLRRLISIGSASSSGGGDAAGGNSSDAENPEDKASERFDAFTTANQEAALQAEQAKLAQQEAAKSTGLNTTQMASTQGAAPAQESDRSAQSNHESVQMQRQQMVQQQQGPQLEFTAQGVQAQTLAKDLERPPERGPDADRLPAPPPQGPLLTAAKEQTTEIATQTPRDPALLRTEARLDATSRQESKQEGIKLDKKGVSNNGTVPETALGELSPARSPAVQRETQVGRA